MSEVSTRLHDEHMHLRAHGVSPLPRHRLAPILEVCAQKGIVPGIREHAPLPARYRLGPDGDYLFCMRPDEVDGFLGELEGTGVAVGLEVDHIDGVEDETRAIVADLLDRARARGIPIGGLTGSVHFIHGRVADLDPSIDKAGIPHVLCDYAEPVMAAHVADRGAEAVLRDYFGCVRRMIGTGFYDVVGHLELVRKFDRRGDDGTSAWFGAVEDVYAEELEQTIRLAADAGIVLEYNTAGRDIAIGRPYLSDDAVRACVRYGVAIALSSDTHVPKHVGRYFDDAVATLRRLGVRELVAVRDRRRTTIPL
jgi:HisJ family histidinol phosphate phosphatase